MAVDSAGKPNRRPSEVVQASIDSHKSAHEAKTSLENKIAYLEAEVRRLESEKVSLTKKNTSAVTQSNSNKEVVEALMAKNTALEYVGDLQTKIIK